MTCLWRSRTFRGRPAAARLLLNPSHPALPGETRKNPMNSGFEKYRQRLLSLRERAMGTVGHVAEAIREDVNPSGTLSGAPVHLADAAELAVESDAEVLQMEGNLLGEIESALSRINEGTYERYED